MKGRMMNFKKVTVTEYQDKAALMDDEGSIICVFQFGGAFSGRDEMDDYAESAGAAINAMISDWSRRQKGKNDE